MKLLNEKSSILYLKIRQASDFMSDKLAKTKPKSNAAVQIWHEVKPLTNLSVQSHLHNSKTVISC